MTSSSESLNNGKGIKTRREEEEVSGKARPVSKPKYLHFGKYWVVYFIQKTFDLIPEKQDHSISALEWEVFIFIETDWAMLTLVHFVA